MIFSVFKKIGFLGILDPPYCGISATIRIGREMLCLPYAGFFFTHDPIFSHNRDCKDGRIFHVCPQGVKPSPPIYLSQLFPSLCLDTKRVKLYPFLCLSPGTQVVSFLLSITVKSSFLLPFVCLGESSCVLQFICLTCLLPFVCLRGIESNPYICLSPGSQVVSFPLSISIEFSPSLYLSSVTQVFSFPLSISVESCCLLPFICRRGVKSLHSICLSDPWELSPSIPLCVSGESIYLLPFVYPRE